MDEKALIEPVESLTKDGLGGVLVEQVDGLLPGYRPLFSADEIAAGQSFLELGSNQETAGLVSSWLHSTRGSVDVMILTRLRIVSVIIHR